MIPNTDYGQTITSGQMKTGGATIELTPEMFTLLSDGMYSDKILAAIRESICNARDAQIEAGEDIPLGIHLPTRLEPFYHVRDYGNGLSERQVLGYLDENGEHVAGLYLRYGKSTKRDTNLQIGGFGIGCKAPLAYSDSFIVESYQQGVVKVYTIYKENGIPNVAKLTEKMTTEPDGLKVKIAVVSSDNDSFCSKATEFLKHFNYPVDITGQSIDHSVEYVLQTDGYDTVKCTYSDMGKVKATMGGVLYNVSDKYREQLEQIVKRDMLIMKFEIGDLSVAGSRENLSEDDMTIAKLDATADKIIKEFYAVMKAEVEDPKHTPFEALQVMRKFDLLKSNWRSPELRPVKDAKDFTINGESVETVLDRYKFDKFRTIRSRGHHTHDTRYKLIDYNELPIVLEVDKKLGYLMVAKKLSQDAGKHVVLVESSGVQFLKEFFGINLTIDKTSVKYDELFPKGAKGTGVVKVAKSGLFNTRGADINEIDETQEGYYIPFVRFDCVMEGKPTGKFTEQRDMNKLIKTVIDAGHLKEDEVFYSRRAGMRAIKKTKLKEMTWVILEQLIRKCFTKQDVSLYVKQQAQPSDNPAVNKHRKLAPLWEAVKHKYPMWNSIKPIAYTKGMVFIKENSSLLSHIHPNMEADTQTLIAKYEKEAGQFKAEFPIVEAFNYYWALTDEMIDDMIEFCVWKNAQNSVQNVAA